ncbi:MAG: hypothetical protein JJU00_16165 [Opitutales bacterium]|nr:hypothetical protein [Opitutales bacterium]
MYRLIVLPLLAGTLFAGILSAQAPEPVLLTPDRLARIQSGLSDPDSHYARAFAQLKARVDSQDLANFDITDTNWNYSRSYYAQAAALVYRVTGDTAYADLAYNTLVDVHEDIDPDGRLPESGNHLLSRATVGLGFGLAYNWAYDGWTEEQRNYVRDRVHVALDAWPGFSHGNLGSTRGSNWVAVCRGGELMMILGIGEQSARSSRVNFLLGELGQHISNGHDAIGATQEGIGYTGYGGIFLLPAIFAAHDAGFGSLWNQIQTTPRHWFKKAMYSGSFASVREGGGVLENLKMFQPSGVGGPNTNDEGWASLLLHSVPAEDMPHFLWWYDRHMGRLAEPTDRPELHYESRRQGTMWALLFYPDDVTSQDPAGERPFLISSDQGRHFMRARWQDTEDISVSIHADLRHHGNAWAQSEAGQTGLIAYGAAFFNGPRTDREPDRYTRMLVNGERGQDTDRGQRKHMEEFDTGAYVVVDGFEQYRNMGVEGYERHLLVEFGDAADNNAMLAMFDRVDAFNENTYTWNANIGNPVADFGIVSSLGEDKGFPTFTLVAPNGGTVKGWVLSPADADLGLVPGERLSIEKTAAAEEFFIVMSVEPETTPPLEVLDHGLAGTVVRLGNKTVALDRAGGTLLRGADAEALELDHSMPLPVRGLTARVTAFDSMELRWLPAETGADSFSIERRGPGETEFSPVTTVSADSHVYYATGLAPDSEYSWRVVPVADGIAGTASETATATTWEDGVRLYVEDFAPRINGELPAVNAIGHWQAVNQDRGWALRGTEGSLRNAHNPVGEMATTGRARINFQNIFFTEDFTADLSTDSAAVEIDIQTEGTIRFSLLLKLADGSWVRTSGEAHIASRFSWHRQRWSIPSISGWREYNVETLSTGAEVSLTQSDLADIRGLGVRAQWPLNERWARADQLHLYAKDFVRLADHPAGTIAFDASAYDVDEDAGHAVLTVVRAGGGQGAVSVDYATSDASAAAGEDYTAVSGTLTWADGDESDKTIMVPIHDDDIPQGDRSFIVALSDPAGGAILGAPDSAVVTIIDDETNEPPSIAVHWPKVNSVNIPSGTGLVLDTTVTDDDGVGTGLYITWEQTGGPDGLVWDAEDTASTGVRFPEDGAYTLRLTASDGYDESTADFAVYVGTEGAGEWESTDIGSTTPAGSASESAGVITVQGSGADIWASADAFHFAYAPLTGDGELVARVEITDNPGGDPWAKAGVMIRETLDANSRNAMTHLSSNNGNRFQYRGSTGGGSSSVGSGERTWVRLVRSGDVFTGYSSDDGESWAQLGTQTIAMDETVYAGLAVTSHNNGHLTTAEFANVSGFAAPGNIGPLVSAGGDIADAVSGEPVALAGAVTDDGLPDPPAATSALWVHFDGAGTAVFADTSSPETSVVFDSPGTHILRLHADDGEVRTFDEALVTVSGGDHSPAESWRLAWFGTTANAGDAAEHEDPDRDGVPNRLERAFGGNPHEPSRAVLPVVDTVEGDGETYLTLTYRQRMGGSGMIGADYTADGLTYTVVQSADPGGEGWSAASVVILDVADDTPMAGIATVTVRLEVPVGEGERQFLALGVSESP